jgi:hypothetical protein
MSHPVARTQGVADGAKAAEISNVALATAMGVQRGATVGIELGFYKGVAAAWVAKGNMCVRRVSFSQTLHPNTLTRIPGSFLRIATTNVGQSWSVLHSGCNSHLPHAPQTPGASVLPHPPNDGVGLGARHGHAVQQLAHHSPALQVTA